MSNETREFNYNFGGLGCAAMMIAFGIMWALIATGPRSWPPTSANRRARRCRHEHRHLRQRVADESGGGCVMRVLVGCEYSGRVRDAFIRRGHDAMSCDLLPTEEPGPHYQGDIRDVLDYPWDLMIAHPPCTDLAVSGARHFEGKKATGRQQASVSFVMMLARAPIPRIAVENPVSILSRLWRKPDQVIQPWQFGHGETKATCLWLKGLPLLVPSNVVEGREARVHRMPPSPDRWKERSRTYEGVAEAFAQQWGELAQEAA